MDKVGSPNANGRVYPPEVVAKALEALAKRPTVMGFVQGNLEISEHEPAFTVAGLRLERDQVLGDINLLPTPAGDRFRHLLEMAEQGAPMTIGFHTCGTGMVSEDGVVSEYELDSVGVTVKPNPCRPT
jgi:hypothetical protein